MLVQVEIFQFKAMRKEMKLKLLTSKFVVTKEEVILIPNNVHFKTK